MRTSLNVLDVAVSTAWRAEAADVVGPPERATGTDIEEGMVGSLPVIVTEGSLVVEV